MIIVEDFGKSKIYALVFLAFGSYIDVSTWYCYVWLLSLFSR